LTGREVYVWQNDCARADGSGYTRVKGEEAQTPRELKTFKSEKKFRVGSLEIIPYEVDHSLSGASAFFIHTSQGTILYTGDYHFHGYKKETTEKMIEIASKEKVDMVITEGTRVNEKKGNTELDVFSGVKELVSDTKELTVVNFPARDMALMKTFYNVAKETGKKLVLELKRAYLLDQLSLLGKDYPRTDDPNICFFAERKSWGLIGRDDFPEDLVQQDYDKWERDYLSKDNLLNYRDIKQSPGDYLFYCSYFMLNEFIDIKLRIGSKYIRSVCEPFDEEMMLDEKRVRNWLSLMNLDGPNQIHASGHASGPELFNALEKIKPKKIIPIHTQHPDLFQKQFNQVALVKTGEKIHL